jgi:crossover junction endodeoxyribonuclease RuvC
MRILLGVDPGFADMGYGVIQSASGADRCLAFGSIGTEAGTSTAIRLQTLYQGLAKVIDQYHPEAAAVERLFFSKNVSTAIAVAEARGVLLLCLADHGIPVREFSPQEVKLAVCGHGAAEKNQVQRMVRMLLGLESIPKPDDAADALALAIALAHTKV